MTALHEDILERPREAQQGEAEERDRDPDDALDDDGLPALALEGGGVRDLRRQRNRRCGGVGRRTS